MTPPRRDIQARSFGFACRIVVLCRELGPRSSVPSVLSGQLLRSGTSIGANLEEAVGASSRKDFVAKCILALKEARETLYWLRLFEACLLAPAQDLHPLAVEADALVAILTTIVRNARANASVLNS